MKLRHFHPKSGAVLTRKWYGFDCKIVHFDFKSAGAARVVRVFLKPFTRAYAQCAMR